MPATIRTPVAHEAAIPQLRLETTLALFAWPLAWYTVLIHLVVRQLAEPGQRVPTWGFLAVMVAGAGLEGLVGLLLLRHEGAAHSWRFRDRIRWQWPRGRRLWVIAGVVLLAGVILGEAAAPVNRWLASTEWFSPPSWWAVPSDPRVEVTTAADAFPDLQVPGNLTLLAAYLIAGLVNVVGEEIYYRGYLLPLADIAAGQRGA